MSSNPMPTPRTRVVRESDRGVYDRDTVNRILDERQAARCVSSFRLGRSLASLGMT